MAITYGFFNAVKQSDGNYDRTYNADQISTYFEGLVSDGVYESVEDGMQVLAATDMQVQVGAGRAIIGSRWIKNTAAYPLTINRAHVTLNRYTAIIIRLDLSARTIEITMKDGDNATTPVKPTMENTEMIKEMCLAYVYVGRGMTAITQANIEDTRADNNVCGWITGIIKQVDTSKLFLQWQTAYEEFYTQMQNWLEEQKVKFDTWFSSLSGELNVNTYIQKFHKTIKIETDTDSFSLEMPGYTYETSDVVLVNINGIALIEGEEYLIETENPISIKTAVPLEKSNTLDITILKSKIGQA